jgi:hypothetical protein
MANLVNCDDNKLIKNNYYFDLSTSNISNPAKLPATHTGIANSGANGFYFAPDAPVDEYNPTAPTVGVRVANGHPEQSVAHTTLASVPSLAPSLMQGHVMPSFTHTLLVWDHSQTKDARSSSQRLQSPFIILTGIPYSPDGKI